jgi:hypothetical protein
MHAFVEFVKTWNEEILAVANVFIALGTIVLALGIPWTLLHAGREERDTFYASLDNMYLEIQKLIIQYPHLAQSNMQLKTAEQVVQYNAFAFISWNFIESIYDYSKKDEMLRETWGVILRHEARVHGSWFNRAENRVKFKPEFISYIERERCIPEERRDGEDDFTDTV